jgi:hypothetical protein
MDSVKQMQGLCMVECVLKGTRAAQTLFFLIMNLASPLAEFNTQSLQTTSCGR